jgi:hypothetical protein
MDTIKNKIIEPFKVVGDWNVQSKKLKGKFPQLTDADLKFETGKEVELLTRVETRLNKKREEVINIIKKGQTQGFKAL